MAEAREEYALPNDVIPQSISEYRYPITIKTSIFKDALIPNDVPRLRKYKLTLQNCFKTEKLTCATHDGEGVYVPLEYQNQVSYAPVYERNVFRTVGDVVLGRKRFDLKWIVVTKRFTYKTNAFQVGQIMQLADRNFRNSFRKNEKLAVTCFYCQERYCLPFCLEGNFMKCGSPHLTVKRSLQDILDAEEYPFLIKLNSRETHAPSQLMFAFDKTEFETVISCKQNAIGKYEIFIFPAKKAVNIEILRDEPFIDVLNDTELQCIKRKHLDNFVHTGESFQITCEYERMENFRRNRSERTEVSPVRRTSQAIATAPSDENSNPIDPLLSTSPLSRESMRRSVGQDTIYNRDDGVDTDEECDTLFREIHRSTKRKNLTSLTKKNSIYGDNLFLTNVEYVNTVRIDVNRKTCEWNNSSRRQLMHEYQASTAVHQIDATILQEPKRQRDSSSGTDSSMLATVDVNVTADEKEYESVDTRLEMGQCLTTTEYENMERPNVAGRSDSDDSFDSFDSFNSNDDESVFEYSYPFVPEILKQVKTKPNVDLKKETSRSVIRRFSVEKVLSMLDLNKLSHRKEKFEENGIDGGLLVELDESNLQELDLTCFEARKLFSYINGWRPTKRSDEDYEDCLNEICFSEASLDLSRQNKNALDMSVKDLSMFLIGTKMKEIGLFFFQENVDGKLLKELVKDDVLLYMKNDHDLLLHKFHLIKLRKIVEENYVPKFHD